MTMPDRQTYGRFVAAMAVEADDFVALRTITGVEVMEVGPNWEASTGPFDAEYEHLQSAIASQLDPDVRTPVLKLGHTDLRFFDGQPAFGRLENLRLSESGQTLLCDLVGVPAWLADIMPTAYPRRSLEGWFDRTTRTGNKWPFVLSGLALLGDAYPAVTTLEDLQLLWGTEAPELVPVADNPVVVASTPLVRAKDGGQPAEEEVPMPTVVKAATSVSKLLHAYYDVLDDEGRYWWWVREVRIDPAELIVDDDEENLYRVPYTIEGDALVFGDPVEVVIEYVDVAAAAGQPAAKVPTAPLASGQRAMAAYASADATGRPPKGATNASTTVEPPGGSVPSATQSQEDTSMQLSEDALRHLGLEPGATEEQVNEAIAKMSASSTETPGDDGNPQSQPETPSDDPTAQPATAPGTGDPAPAPVAPTTEPGDDGTVKVDKAQWEQVLQTAQEAGELVSAAKATAKRELLEGAVKAGKFPKARMDHWGALYDADPEGTKATISTLAAGVVPVTERGVDEQDGGVAASSSAYPESWKSTVQAAQTAVGTGRVKVGAD